MLASIWRQHESKVRHVQPRDQSWSFGFEGCATTKSFERNSGMLRRLACLAECE